MPDDNPPLLDGYLTLAEAAEQPGMPSVRTLQRMIKRRELPITYLGKKPLIQVSTFREALRRREISPIEQRRKRRAGR